jgi:Na+-translocating ferredoxin:NAD+ oxidoreductase RnfC subunit
MCIVIDSDGKDKWIEIEKCDQDFLRCAPSKVIQRIRLINIFSAPEVYLVGI